MKNKKVIILIAIVLVIVIIACIIFFSKNGVNSVKEISSNLGQATWLSSNESMVIDNGEDKITLVIDSDLNFDKTATDYQYVVPYVLKVNDKEYSGSHTFGVGYTMHSEANDMPYNVEILDFETGTIEVQITEKVAQ